MIRIASCIVFPRHCMALEKRLIEGRMKPGISLSSLLEHFRVESLNLPARLAIVD